MGEDGFSPQRVGKGKKKRLKARFVVVQREHNNGKHVRVVYCDGQLVLVRACSALPVVTSLSEE